MNRTMTIMLTIAALSIAIPASADDCVPNLARQAEVDTGAGLHSQTGGHDCDEGLGQTGCDVSREARGQPAGAPGGGLRIYFDNDNCQRVPPEQGSCTISIWGYFETNGIDGLQRNDGGTGDDLVKGVDDTCGGQIEADLLFI